MATRINIINSILDFYTDIEPLIDKLGFHFYIEHIKDSKRSIIRIKDSSQLSSLMSNSYKGFYITSEVFNETINTSFFDDSFFHHVIEGLGGRISETEVENISLRIVSKTPDKKIKTFQSSILKVLKSNEGYCIGLSNGSSSFYKKTFYKKSTVLNRTMWFDFSRKIEPILLNNSAS